MISFLLQNGVKLVQCLLDSVNSYKFLTTIDHYDNKVGQDEQKREQFEHLDKILLKSDLLDQIARVSLPY